MFPGFRNTGGKFTPKTTRSDPDHANSDRLRIMHRKDNSIDKMDQNSLRALASVFPTFSSLPVSVARVSVTRQRKLMKGLQTKWVLIHCAMSVGAENSYRASLFDNVEHIKFSFCGCKQIGLQVF